MWIEIPLVRCSIWLGVFRDFDKDNSGYIEASELPKILEEGNFSSEGYDKKKFEKFIAEHDVDKDGKMDYKEFLNFIRGNWP